MGETTIQWTDATWNPVTGCTKVSAGCKNCYAERIFPRSYAKTGRSFTDVACHPERLEQPLRWRKPRRVFVNSMSDLFHEDVPAVFIAEVMARCAKARQHQFQILTKRPERMLELFAWKVALPNVWLGVSVEDQATADERIPLLLETPAAVRFVSYEPALGPVDFTGLLSEIHWLIIGGESGPGARPCDVKWIRSAMQQATDAGVPVFVKQLGSRPVETWGSCTNTTVKLIKLRDHKGGDPSEWPADLRVREWPEVEPGRLPL